MGHKITKSGDWIEVVELTGFARECWTFCLEPDEVLRVTVRASCPLDLALTDWEDYRNWGECRFVGMPVARRFANDSQSVSWEEMVADAPYLLVLVIANPGQQENQVTVQATALSAARPIGNQDRAGPLQGTKKPATSR